MNHPAARGPAARSRTAKLALYRECLILCRTIQDARLRRLSLAEVRDKWRENKGVGGQSLELALASTLDRLSYLRLCTPKRALEGLPCPSLTYDWGVVNPLEHYHRITTRDSDESPTPGSDHGAGHRNFVPMSNWGQKNLDPDMITRHKELLDRQFFMGPHWRGKPKPLVYEALSFEEQIAVHFSPPPARAPEPIKKKF